MALEKECAALSVIVCGGNRSVDVPTPKDWSRLPLPPSDPLVEGFRASAFANRQGDTVLAFSGPDFHADARAASNDDDEFVTNLALDLGLADFTEALQQATSAFAQVRRQAASEGKDPGRIHFTGHGVGGGIAAVMSVWFDQPCTVFAQAPLRAVALMPGDFARARATIETLMGSADGSVRALQGFIRHPKEMLAQREKLRVTHWHVRGEIHALLRSPATAIQGTEHVIDIGIQPPTVQTALTLHDMKLHAALLFDPRLARLCQDAPDLLAVLLDRADRSDLIETLLADQHRVGLDGESALQRFVNGLEWRGETRADNLVTEAAAR